MTTFDAKAFLATVPQQPGVYRMLNQQDVVIYVGKAKDLKKRGFKFVGPTIVYAWAQAVGMVNDHDVTCPRHKAVQAC